MTSTIRCGACRLERTDQLVDDDSNVIPCPACGSLQVVYEAARPGPRLRQTGTEHCARCGVPHTVYEVASA